MEQTEQTWVQPVVAGIFDMSAGRLGAIVASVAGLIAVVLGGLALRSVRRPHSNGDAGAGNGRGRPTVSIVLGLLGLVLGALVIATADGGLGTGNGRGGGFVAVALGLIGLVFGGLARTHRQ